MVLRKVQILGRNRGQLLQWLVRSFERAVEKKRDRERRGLRGAAVIVGLWGSQEVMRSAM